MVIVGVYNITDNQLGFGKFPVSVAAQSVAFQMMPQQ
jgi:hypothetical protein